MWSCVLAAICSLQVSAIPLSQVSRADPTSPVALAVAHTQTEAEATRPELSSALSRLKAQQKIRVEALNVNPIEGRFHRVSDSTLVLELTEEDLSVPKSVSIASIQSLQIEKDRKGQGALIGAVAGAILMAGWAADQEEETVVLGETQTAGAAMGGAIVGALGGAIVGFIIGSATNRWVEIYPVP
jgi:hypothetical protein